MKTTPVFALVALAAFGLSGLGCGTEFEPYNRLASLRVLALRAEPVDVVPGGSTRIDALLYVPEGETVEYSWSWCPLRAGAAGNFACLVSEEELSTILAAAGFSELMVSYDLGHEPTAELDYFGTPELLAALCAAPPTDSFPSQDSLPSCEEGFSVSVDLTVRAGGEEVDAYKGITFLFDAQATVNRNPQLAGARVAKSPGDATQAKLLCEEAPCASLVRGDDYDLFLDIDEAEAESYEKSSATGRVPARESLTITWFVEGGDTEKTRTTFIPGEVGFDVLTRNLWTAPYVEKFNRETSALTLVIRDGRGGVGWLTRTVNLTDR